MGYVPLPHGNTGGARLSLSLTMTLTVDIAIITGRRESEEFLLIFF